MGAVARDARLDERIEHFLAYLTGEWGAIPELAAEWGEWTPYERLDFALEWPIREDRLGQLRQYAEQGLMTRAQRERYGRLLKLIAQHRPTLEQLLQPSRPTPRASKK